MRAFRGSLAEVSYVAIDVIARDKKPRGGHECAVQMSGVAPTSSNENTKTTPKLHRLSIR